MNRQSWAGSFARYALTPVLVSFTLAACSFSGNDDGAAEGDMGFLGAIMASLDGGTNKTTGGGATYLTGELVNGDNFGHSIASIGDIDDDGIEDMIVGAPLADDGGASRGAVFVLFMNFDGTIKEGQRISDTDGGFTGVLDDDDRFGTGVAGLGDLDGDGVEDVAVGVRRDDDGGNNRGAIYVLFLDTDGTVKSHQKISNTAGGFGGGIGNGDQMGFSLAAIGDLNADGRTELAVGAINDDDGGGNRGAVYILFLNTDGTVSSEQKISDSVDGFGGNLANNDKFGWSVAGIEDINNDNVPDIAVGAALADDGGDRRGALWVLFMNADGTVNGQQKISDTDGNFTGTLDDNDRFGNAVVGIGDFNIDTVPDIVVGAYQDDDGGNNRGAAYVLFMNTNGTVQSHMKLSYTNGYFGGVLSNNDRFGAGLGVIDMAGTPPRPELLVGAIQDDDGGSNRGAVWILDQNADGTVSRFKKLSSLSPGIGCTVSGTISGEISGVQSGVESPVTSDITSRPESYINTSPCIYVPPPPPVACSAGGPSVIFPDPGNPSTEVDSYVTPDGELLVARLYQSLTQPINTWVTNCKREIVETPSQATPDALRPNLARFEGTNFLGFATIDLTTGSARCTISKMDMDGNVLAGPVNLIGGAGGYNTVSMTSLSNGNVMVLCRDQNTTNAERTFIYTVDSNLNTVSTVITNEDVVYWDGVTQLAGGNVVAVYSDRDNNFRGTIRVMSATGTTLFGPTTFTTNQIGEAFAMTNGFNAVVVYTDVTAGSLRMIEVNSSGTVIGGPHTLDSGSNPFWLSMDRSTDGTYYVSYARGLSNYYLRFNLGGVVLGGPYTFASSLSRSELGLADDFVIIDTREGIYTFAQDP